jgi:hypothetical protein
MSSYGFLNFGCPYFFGITGGFADAFYCSISSGIFLALPRVSDVIGGLALLIYIRTFSSISSLNF